MAQDKPGKNGSTPEWERGAPPPQPFKIWKGPVWNPIDVTRGTPGTPGTPFAPDPSTVFPGSDRWPQNKPDNPFAPPSPDVVRDKNR